ncbi:hypothetical protein RGU12_19495 [Fredinandcohnia sp. QZ13]|uniref:hypothetical protein n=1 Tax=Fredinandcohnia sp. QZ13 TaxID=3073144 RepID=UPI0028532FAB|nr:hypothetical protein [Fredinandcohnia sp. QZ13]MDR4889682.1 hypothetical protein [Fredinandcohnia sp. QZ13]
MDNHEIDAQAKSDNRNYIRVNNNINFTINLGDSLNLLALIAGLFFFKTLSKKNKLQKENKRKKALILP